MGRFTAIPQDTFEALQLDAGVLLNKFDPENPVAPADEDIICSTTGGIKIDCVPTYSDMGEDVDNCPNNMKELKHLDSWECTMGFTMLKLSPAGIKLGLGSADANGNKVTPRRTLSQSDFSDLWWVGDKSNGGMVAVKLMNALSTSGLSIQSSKNGKGQTSVTLTGHVSIDDQDTMPMEFYSSDVPGKTDKFVGDGTTTEFTLSETPAASSTINVYVDGALKTITTDYTLTGKKVTFVTAPTNGEEIRVDYIYAQG